MVPAVGRSSVPSIESRVLLPLPLGPMIAANTPSSRVSVTSSTARTTCSPDENSREMFLAASIYSFLITSAGRMRAVIHAGTALPSTVTNKATITP